MYVLPDSNAIKAIRETINTIIPYLDPQSPRDDKHREEMRKLGNEMIFFSCHLKPYKGHKWDGEGFSGNETMFYDEKEWRYIPDYKSILEKSLRPYIFSHEYMNESKKDEFNDIFKQHFKLGFKPGDIKYIIVDGESEVLDMAEKIEGLKSPFAMDEVKLLITRIISVERLRADF